MKKILVLIVLLFVSISLYAQKPLIKFIDENGSETKYNIEDISEMNFVNTDMLYKMFVYKKDTTNMYIIANVKSIVFADTNKLKINLQKSSKILYIAEIDSIVLIPNDCSEVKIGEQTWTCKNLDVDHYRNGDPIPEVQDSAEWANLKTGAWCYYNNDPALGAIYGRLYNWYAVNDPRGLAPTSWHVPNKAEWEILISSLGGNKSAGGKLKMTGTLEDGDGFWFYPNVSATDESGFSAIPGGYRYGSAQFSSLNKSCLFWISTAKDDSSSFNYYIPQISGSASLTNYNNSYGFSVRCMKGDDLPLPIINSISPDSAFIGDVVTLFGENFATVQGTNFVSINDIKLQQSDYISWSDTEVNFKIPLGTFSGRITVTVYWNESNAIDFNVKRKFDYGTVTDYDGNVYKTLKLGGNWWMESNLKVKHYRNGDPIPEVKDNTEWSNLKTGAWCDYNNDPAMEATYGALYNWFTVNDPRGLAPEGWHVATDAEWNSFIDSLGGNDLAGSKLKDVRNDYWLIPNEDATNESGFSAKPAGQRGYKGEFDYLGYFSYWWTYQEYDSNMARLKRLYYDCGWTGNYDYYKYYGYSVRCVKGVEIPAPKINSVSPDPVSMGDILTITGENFGKSQGTNYVRIYSNKLPQSYYQSWADKEIKVKMPKGLPQSLASVTVNGRKSKDIFFNVVNITNPPRILSISPDSAEIGDVITIKGKNFGEVKDSGYVLFNDKKSLLSD